MDEKLSAEELAQLRESFDVFAYPPKDDYLKLFAHIAALEAELVNYRCGTCGEVLFTGGCEECEEAANYPDLPRTKANKAEADKQIAVEALNTINRLPESTIGYLMAETARQALSRIEEK
jgi:hypothetical protein